jgi:CHASE3 domain sensor protein
LAAGALNHEDQNPEPGSRGYLVVGRATAVEENSPTMSQLLRIMEELRAILKDEKQLGRITDPELIQLRSLLDEQRSVLWRIEQEKAKKTGD